MDTLTHSETQTPAEVLHHLRAPLAAVRLAHEALLQNETGNLTDEQIQILTECQSRTLAMSRYLDDIANQEATLSQVQKLALDTYQVSMLLQPVLEEYRSYALHKHIQYDVNVDNAVSSIRCDRSLVMVALRNVLDNAFKYTEAGGVVAVQVRVEDSSLVLQVIDTGIGVPEGESAQLFSKYIRLSNARKIDSAGSGLGLSIAKSIVQAHHGTITYSARVPIGSVFTLTLPLSPDA